MPETLLSPSSILLYGRIVTDLKVTPAAAPGRAAQLLQGQLSASNARFARIYGFSYEGRYYDLSKPAIFLVHGDGDAAGTGVDARGVAASASEFSSDIKVWAYDKGDFSIRMDVETGALEQILLEAGMKADVTLGGSRLTLGGSRLHLRSPGTHGPGRGGHD